MSKSIPRLPFEKLQGRLAALLQPRVQRLGYLGEFFQVMAHKPDALAAFVEFTESAKSGLDKRLIEVIALTAATALGNAYERHQHERLSVRLGFGRDWVATVEKLDPEGASLLSPREQQLQRFVIDSVRSHGNAAPELFAGLVDWLGSEQAVAVLMVVGRYVAHACMVNTLRLAPPVPSIWDDGFAG